MKKPLIGLWSLCLLSLSCGSSEPPTSKIQANISIPAGDAPAADFHEAFRVMGDLLVDGQQQISITELLSGFDLSEESTEVINKIL